MEDLYVPNQTLLVVTAVGLVAWCALVLAILLARLPKPVRAGPETTELGDEPPGVANLVAHRFKPTRDAVPATLIDLAARGIVEIEDRGIGRYVCLVGPGAKGDSPAEKLMVDHLRSRAVGGEVPAEALTTGPQDRSKAWWNEFRKCVVEDAQGRGLSRDLWDKATVTYVFLALLPLALTFWTAVGFRDLDEVEESPLLTGVLMGGAAVFGILLALAGSKRQRSTDTGRTAAARWLGVRQAFESSPSFPELPPSGVVVWERHLAYAAALGVAPRAIRALPMGAESDTEAWTASSGEWRKVSVRYPRLRPGWGRAPALAVAIGAFGSYVGYNMVRLAAEAMGFAGWTLAAAVVAASLGGIVLLRSALQLVWGLADLPAAREVEGVVLRARSRWSPWPYLNQGDEHNARYFVAIDDKRSTAITAYRVTAGKYAQLAQGTHARLRVTPRLGYVTLGPRKV